MSLDPEGLTEAQARRFKETLDQHTSDKYGAYKTSHMVEAAVLSFFVGFAVGMTIYLVRN